MSSPRTVPLVALACACLAPALGAAQEDSVPGWRVRVLDASSGAPLSGAVVTFPEGGVTRVTDGLGVVDAVPAEGGRLVRAVVARSGYQPVDTVLAVALDGGTSELLLVRSATELSALTVEANRAGASSRELARVIFDREVAVGAVGMTSSQVGAVPAMVEADVFRSLRSLAGVSGVNDFNAGVYVRGGNSDQISVRWEGAPVFGPYHLFGMFGVFNSDAVETAELYKGSIPARYGGALSGVVSVRQRAGGHPDAPSAAGGLSLLGVRAMANGVLPWGGVRWLAAGRQATVDAFRVGGPYAFHDLSLGFHAYPNEEHRLALSMLASDDRFSWEVGGVGGWFDSRWSNLVSSLAWAWVGGNRVSSEATAYASRYETTLATRTEEAPRTTRNDVLALGVRGEVSASRDRTGFRAGVAVEGGPVSLHGSGAGAYVEGDASGSYLHLSVFGEFERWIGPLRLAPGVRASVERSASLRFLEPRLAARLHLGPLAVSASVDRTHQFLSVLHDDRFPQPGAPMWFTRERGQPASSADGASLALDAWKGERWTGSVGGWTRRFRSIPSWRPQASRLVSEMAFHDGDAYGWEATAQRHGGRLRGWISYQWVRVRLAGSGGADYLPAWDRRHKMDAVVTVPGWRGWSASLRAAVATGTPFWVELGWYYGIRYDPNTIGNDRFGAETRDDRLRGLSLSGDRYIVFSDVQGRVPYYARVDVSIRRAIRWGSAVITPFLSISNLTDHDNPYSYTAGGHSRKQIPRLPFVGVDLRF